MSDATDMTISRPVQDDCYNPYESYGECCVRCGCCARDLMTRTRARRDLHKRLAEAAANFNDWAYDSPELMALQKESVLRNKTYHQKRAAYYNRRLKQIRKGEQ